MAANFIDISRLHGAEELQADLKTLPIAIQRKLLRKGLRTAANIHLRAAKAEALAFSKGKEGRLDEPFMPKVAKRLKVRALRRSRKGFGFRVVTPTLEELGLPPGRKGYPPAHVELGTRKSAALPFMRRPFDVNEPRMTRAISDSIREAIDETWARSRGEAVP